MKNKNFFDLKQKKIVVVGGSRGIGKIISKTLNDYGAKVIVLSRSNNENENEKKIIYKKCDINNLEDLSSAYLYVKKKFKKFDVLYNCAGISNSSKTNGTKDDNFEKIIITNLISIYNLTKKFVKILNRNSSIVNISSIASYQGFPKNPGYISSKAGLSGLTRALAYDFSDKDIRVNNLVLGYFPTDMTKDSFKDKKKFEVRKNKTLFKRWGRLNEICGPAIFLASDSSSYVTGSDIVVDGGWSVNGL